MPTNFVRPPPPQVQACADEAERLLAARQYAAAAEQLLQAIGMGHLPSRALMAWLLVWGREGIAKDERRALELVEEGVLMGCEHCQGVLAFCIHNDQSVIVGNVIVMRDDDPEKEKQTLRLALQSSKSGSRYGHYVLGTLYSDQDGNISERTLSLWQQAADQGLDAAQLAMGHSLYMHGIGNLDDHPEALRFYRLAAAQGQPSASFCVGLMHELGHGVPEDAVEALVWYKRAVAEGHERATICVQKLGAQ
jgi:TPR repeat protein